MENTEHTTIRNNNLFCLNCGGSHALVYPIPVKEMGKKIKAFNSLHKDCPKTWEEPIPKQSDSTIQKAMFWFYNGEKGLSSEAMWHCLMGKENARTCHPHDPDDFSRCYKLLLFVPEWKNQLSKVAELSPEWSRLIENWQTLSEMFERNQKENWANYKKVGMYELMQKCIYPNGRK